jgi:riboflavin kinase/FMN adenylyltransferase
VKIIDHFEDFRTLNYPVVTSGTFDGVHSGHCKILNDLVSQAKQQDGESVVITFWPHPRFVLGKNAGELKLLSTFEEKANLIEKCGVDYLLKVRFSRKFSELSSEEFIQKVLIGGIKAKKLIIGYDHHFGKDQKGEFQYLKENQDRFGFEVEEISRLDIDHVGVSSTKIRQALGSGDVKVARSYLGRLYTVRGIVTKGDQIGRKIGFPTANIYVPEDYKLIPGDGVYAVKVNLENEQYEGMLNIGKRPTVDGRSGTIEVNIFNFDRDIYGLNIEVQFVDLVRSEIKFGDLTELTTQLQKDKEAVKRILAKKVVQ